MAAQKEDKKTEEKNENQTAQTEVNEKIEENETKQEIAKSENKTPATVNSGSSYIAKILEETKQGFIEANAGLDMDFVRMGDWLSVSKKGNFVEKDDEDISYGDTIDVVIAQGEKRWSLWGEQDSPEEGLLIVASREQEDAERELAGWLSANPEAAERYSSDDIKLRYMCYVVPVDSLKPDEFPIIYLMSFSQTDTILFGKYAMNIYKGKYKKMNIPGRIGVNRVVTRLETVERTSRSNASNQWIGVDCKPLGLFDPKDYGIDPDEQKEE